MSKRRVVVTGLGLESPIGSSLDMVSEALRAGRHGIRHVDEWRPYGVETRVGGVVADVDQSICSRKQLRAMGKVARLAVSATHAAVKDAGLGEEIVRHPRTALFYGSTDGSTGAAEDYYRKLYTTNSFSGLLSSMYLKFMSHTCAANLAQVFGVTGRVLPICSACTSASQAIGEGYHAIASGREDVAIAGGAEELHVTVAGVFDLMLATSVKYNDAPELTPRPFDAARDGLVVGEGAGTLVLESWEHAQARGARVHAELLGYGTNCDGVHLTSPSPDGMSGAMRLALAEAGVPSDRLDYVNAHATGTEIGDIAESIATLAAIGPKVPISSTKGHTGHTLGGCGAIESIFVIAMLEHGFLPPTRNLERVDERCAALNYLTGEVRSARPRLVMNNNFAFGGINTSLVFGHI
ncbi:MAG TPA: beta-ketoacyl-ACP synthase [Nannocystaceae bacterium]|nr:beta-ketoacyl-ACP synthase [Nannocystaceae bacterium]